MSGLVFSFAEDNVWLKIVKNGLSSGVSRYSLILSFKSSKVFLLLVPMDMSYPFLSGRTPRNTWMTRGVIALDGLILHVLGLIGQSKICDTVIIPNAVYVVERGCGGGTIVDQPNKPMLSDVEPAYTAVSVALNVSSKSFPYLLLSGGLDEIQASVSVFEKFVCGVCHRLNITAILGRLGGVFCHISPSTLIERIQGNIQTARGQHV